MMMTMSGKNIGFAVTGSHCTYQEIWPQVSRLREAGAEVYPIVSSAVAESTTRFGAGPEIVAHFAELTGRSVIATIVEAEPLGPSKVLDCLIVAPCTGNTLAKLANAITDTAVLMAAKTQLRNGRPWYWPFPPMMPSAQCQEPWPTLECGERVFVPFGQDNPKEKPRSQADMELVLPTIEKALLGMQLQPILVERTMRSVR